MECFFCKNIFSSKTNLNNHQKRATYCLKLRGIDRAEDEHKCNACNRIFPRKYELDRHIKVCKKNTILTDYEKTIESLREENFRLKTHNKILIENLERTTESYHKLSMAVVSQGFDEDEKIEIFEE